jgi:hypothetical protein
MDDRDDLPGISIVPGAVMPPQITYHHVESMAMHSRSQGWIPAVRLLIELEDGTGIVGVITSADVPALQDALGKAAARAQLDVAMFEVEGPR